MVYWLLRLAFRWLDDGGWLLVVGAWRLLVAVCCLMCVVCCVVSLLVDVRCWLLVVC